MRLFYILTILAIFTSCGLFDDNSQDVIAEVYGKKLLKSNLVEIVPEGLASSDSIQFVNNYINNWIHKELLIATAEKNLSEDQKDFTQLIDHYKNSLLIYNYEQELVNQKLDTVVSEKEIVEYYEKHSEQFLVSTPMMRIIFVKLAKDVSSKSIFDKLFRSDKAADKDKLEQYCVKYASNYSIDDNAWLTMDVVDKLLPESILANRSSFSKNQILQTSDSVFVYYIKVKDFKGNGDLSPLSSEKNNIKELILNQRKIKLITQIEQQIYLDALQDGKITIYKNK